MGNPGEAPVPELELDAVVKRFGDTLAVDRVSLRVWPGEFLSLLGPSGCGKTTTLRMVAGFATPDSGRILHRGADITRVPPYHRDVGLVFQSYALFPHMTVAQNVAFGLRMRRASRAVIRERVQWALDLVRLTKLDGRRPHELSGGQQQRVAVARVLAAGASMLLLDEPFSNLDAKLRKAMQMELRELQQSLRMATIHVTHDQEEAMTMSDRLVIMNQGAVEQDGTPETIYREPVSAFVADFVGRCNMIPGRVAGVDGGSVTLELDGGDRLQVPWKRREPLPERVVAFVRPEHVRVTPAGAAPPRPNTLAGRVRRRIYQGSIVTLHVALRGGTEVLAELSTATEEAGPYDAGTNEVALHIPAQSLRLLLH
jgi:ABC-type Fe3+/spermidine/putrescine transport system ATPase subunit